jgi:sulfatase modifying factor 1
MASLAVAGASNGVLGIQPYPAGSDDGGAPDATDGSGSSSGADSGSSSGSDAGAGDGSSAVCTPGATQCTSSSAEQTCTASGQWGASTLCPFVCSGGACAGACSPGAVQCSSGGVETCAGNGQWGAAQLCAGGMCTGGVCTGACTSGATQCSGNGVQMCSGGQWGTPAPCTSQACVGGSCTGVCAPGAIQCAGNGVETCTPAGQWGTPVACGSSQACAGGTCGLIMAPSCAAGGAGMTDCAPGGSASCCASQEVAGGTFDRSYDGLSSGYTNTAHPATVSSFQLDQYEVTVGRFRQFVGAVVGGWLPSAGSGKHTHLDAGQGLSATAGGYEAGWDAVNWNSKIATTSSGWNTNLMGGTWTPVAAGNENLPITLVDWFEAYAFCIWDGGFLPSEAEWNYAAAGGSEQRVYPWSSAYPPGSTSVSCADANYSGCPAGSAIVVGSDSPAGDGKWGQSDLAGNVWEWNLDWYATYVTPCTDCANLTAATNRVIRGGGLHEVASLLLASYRNSSTPSTGGGGIGARCARTP